MYKRQIVGSNTFINDTWFELNDEVLGYKIETIANDYVILKNNKDCLLYTSDAADERSSVDLGGRRIIKKKKNIDSME